MDDLCHRLSASRDLYVIWVHNYGRFLVNNAGFRYSLLYEKLFSDAITEEHVNSDAIAMKHVNNSGGRVSAVVIEKYAIYACDGLTLC